MSLTWRTRPSESLPQLAWLAGCSRERLSLHHGRAVETWPGSFFEGAWAGPFEARGFAEAATVAGSGAVATKDGVTFVAPSHTLEGLWYRADDDALVVSNSLAFLLEHLGATVHRDPHVGSRFASAVLGIEEYQRRVLETDKGPISRLLHHNLAWRPGTAPVETPKPTPFEFPDYKSYRDALRTEMGAVFANAADPARKVRYTPVSTCSSGYDSTACLVLAQELGCDRAVTLTTARGGQSDGGEQIAEVLGVALQSFERTDSAPAEQTAEFLATGMGGEDVIYTPFEPAIAGSVLLTGFHGDKIWSKGVKPSSTIVRGDVSGCSLGEFRLRCGFVHLPVPFIAAEKHSQLADISNSPVMQPWSIGGWYDRPIPRRIAEDAGIPREAFGIDKKAASLLLFLAPQLRAGGMSGQASQGIAQLPRMERTAVLLRERLFRPRLSAARLLDKAQKVGGPVRPVARALRDLFADDPRLFEHDKPSAAFLFEEALAQVRKRYSVVSPNDGGQGHFAPSSTSTLSGSKRDRPDSGVNVISPK